MNPNTTLQGTIIRWQTGSRYSRHGQVITAVLLDAETIVFEDHCRQITGVITLTGLEHPPVTDAASLQALVNADYLHNRYSNDTFRTPEIKAAASRLYQDEGWLALSLDPEYRAKGEFYLENERQLAAAVNVVPGMVLRFPEGLVGAGLFDLMREAGLLKEFDGGQGWSCWGTDQEDGSCVATLIEDEAAIEAAYDRMRENRDIVRAATKKG